MVNVFKKGQRVTVGPANNQNLTPRDSALEPYVGRAGTVMDIYWINIGAGSRNFHVYKVRIDNEDEEIVVHEDEIKG